MKTQIIEIKTGTSPINQIVEAVQGDSGRVLRCIISDMSIPAGSTARFYAVKPSGAEIYNDCTIDGQAVVLDMTTQMLAEVGILNGQIEVTKSGKTVTSFEFYIDVKKNRKSSSAVESSNEYTALENALSTVSWLSDPTVTFTDASSRTALTTGSKLSVLMGRISKWLKDLKYAAFCDTANNDTTTASGYVADARIVKTHGDEIDALANKVFSYVGQASTTAINVNLTAGTYLVLTSHSNSSVVGMYLVIASDTAVTSYTLITPTGASLTASMSGRSFRISTPGASVTVYKCKIA